jgi:hypothetical protein
MVSKHSWIKLHQPNNFQCSKLFSSSSNNVLYDYYQAFLFQLSSLAQPSSSAAQFLKPS